MPCVGYYLKSFGLLIVAINNGGVSQNIAPIQVENRVLRPTGQHVPTVPLLATTRPVPIQRGALVLVRSLGVVESL